jgi:hypothetical protein
MGIPSIGVEPSPMPCFASETKVDWTIDPECLLEHAAEVGRITSGKLEAQGIEDGESLPLFHGRSKRNKFPVNLRTLPPEIQDLLLTDSISPLPLHKTLVLLETIEELKAASFVRHEKLALAKGLVSEISNVKFGPEVGIGSPKKDAAVVPSWLRNVRIMAEDLRKLESNAGVKAAVHRADARRVGSALRIRSTFCHSSFSARRAPISKWPVAQSIPLEI